MSVLVHCFRCGKAVLVRQEQTVKTPYCTLCRNSLGLPDEPAPPEAELVPSPPPQPRAAEPKSRPPLVKKAAPDWARPAKKWEDVEDDRGEAPRRRSSGSGRMNMNPGVLVAIIGGGVLVLVLLISVVVLAVSSGGRNSPPPVTSAWPPVPPEPQPTWRPPQVQAPPLPIIPPPTPTPAPTPLPPVVNPNPVIPRLTKPIPPEVALLKTIPVAAGDVWAVDLNPDGDTALTGSGPFGKPGAGGVYAVSTGLPAGFAFHPNAEILSVAYRSDGERLAFANGREGVQVFGKTGGVVLANFRHPSYVRSVAFSPTDERLASNCERTLKVWDLATKQELWSVNLPKGELAPWRIPTRLAFSPDGKTLAAGNGGRDVCLHDAATGQVLATCQGHTSTVLCTAYSPTGQMLASGGVDCTVKVWNAATGREWKTLASHPDWVYQVAFASDGRTLASAYGDGSVILWDASTGDKLVRIPAHTRAAQGVAFSPKEKILATCGLDGAVRIWDVSRFVGAR
jgi:WD domain, G-beta repeat